MNTPHFRCALFELPLPLPAAHYITSFLSPLLSIFTSFLLHYAITPIFAAAIDTDCRH
jgi:hypothetical protein